MRRRRKRSGSRVIKFSLYSDRLVASHFGKPFDEADVKSICGIGESAKKELTDIGRFGIGFKSVYAFTDKPEVHSGHEHFAIEDYVLPKAVPEIPLETGETKILIPFKDDEQSAYEDILNGLRELGPHTLLFLREIEEISWKVDDGSSGRYSRVNANGKKRNSRKILLTGKDGEEDGLEEEWLVFSRRVYDEGKNAGQVEIAFALNGDGDGVNKPSILKVNDSPLVAFFPTNVSTHLGFLAQGPYRTTPSRDNVPEDDTWNRYLVEETAKLLVEALRQLQEFDLFDVLAIECLPLDPPSQLIWNDADWSKWRFAPLFEAVKNTLMIEPLLPAYRGGYIAGENAALAGSQKLRELVSSDQLARLLRSERKLAWLSEEITPDRTSEVHTYMTSVLDIDEVTPEYLVRRLSLNFLEDQSDDWLKRLYEFLNGRKGLLPSFKSIPLVRLEDGTHTTASSENKPNAYLPGDTRTNYPTVRQNVCQSEEALDFLKSLGLGVPEPVDNIIENILPKYSGLDVNISDKEYEDHIQQILIAFDTDSLASRTRLTSALRKARFVSVVDAGKEKIGVFVMPADAYMATERLTRLFEGVPGVLLMDNSKECLRGERIRDLLRAVHAPEYLLPIPETPSLTDEEKAQLRIDRGWGRWDITRYRGETVKDYALRGLDALLEVLIDLPRDQASDRARILWDALCDVRSRRGDAVFRGEYSWFYRTDRHASFPASFIKTLNQTAWVPDKDGVLQCPRDVFFEETRWMEDPYILSRIEFKPAVIGELAKEAGVEPGLIDLVKRLGITEAQLRERFADLEDVSPDESSSNGEGGTLSAVSGQADEGPGPEASSDNGSHQPPMEPTKTEIAVFSSGSGREGRETTAGHTDESDETKTRGRWEFRSYIAVSSDEPNEESSGLSHEEKLRLEDRAIDLIISEEPDLQRTPTNNPGFDLMEVADGGEIVRFIEVKAMSGTLQDRPATLTKKQFECAQQERNSYWLYIVENAGDAQMASIVKINDLAGWAKTFTFDHGWKEVSQEAQIRLKVYQNDLGPDR